MSSSFFVRTLATSFRYTLLVAFRGLSAGWFIGLQVLGPIFFLLTSWIVAQIVASTIGYGYFASKSGVSDYLTFATIGFAFQGVIMNTTWNGAHSIRLEQEFGTAEVLFATPANKVAWILGRLMAIEVFSLITTIIVIAFGYGLFGYHAAAAPDLPTALLGLILTLISMAAFGFSLAGITFIIKREDDVNQVLWPTMVFFCGLAFPIEVLPLWVQAISWLFPITHGLDITRKAVLLGLNAFHPLVLTRVLVLAIQTVLLIPLGLALFHRMLRVAKRTGALATY